MPLTIAAALWVMLPLPAAVLSVSEVALMAASASALLSLIETAPPLALMLAKSLPALLRVIALAPALTVVAPLTMTAPTCVDRAAGGDHQRAGIGGVEGEGVDVSDDDGAAGRADAAEVVAGDVEGDGAAAGVDRRGPADDRRRVLVTLPLPALVSTVRLEALIAFSASALLSVTATAPPETPMLAKSLPALVRVTAPVPAVIVVVPLTTAAPVCVIGPLPALVSSVSAVVVIGPRTRPLSSRTATVLPVAAKVAKLLPGNAG